MDWCVRPFERANHQPVAVFDGDLVQTVMPGERVNLSAKGSHDPDGDDLSFCWYFYREPSTYNGPLDIVDNTLQQAYFAAPDVDSLRTIHIVLTVIDNGTPPLARYRRVIFTVEPG